MWTHRSWETNITIKRYVSISEACNVCYLWDIKDVLRIIKISIFIVWCSKARSGQ